MARSKEQPQTTGTEQRRLTLGYLAPNISDNVGLARWHGVADVARERDVCLLCFPGSYWRDPGASGQANVIYDLVNPEIVDGLVLGNILQEGLVDQDELQRFHDRHAQIPLVSIRKTLDGVPYVPLDNYLGMREAIVHLIEVHGVRRIAFLRGPEGHLYAQERYQAYKDTLEEYGLPVEPDLITPPSDWDTPAIQLLLDERRLSPPTDFDAVVAVNDYKGLDALEAFRARGLRVPEDVAVVGFNDDEQDRAVTPPLTSVAMPFYEQGRQATEMLLSMLQGEQVPEQVSLPARLVVRQSCGCLSPIVVQAAAKSGKSQYPDLGTAVQEQREQILAELVQPVEDSKALPESMEHLLDLFVAEISGSSSDSFLSALNAILALEAIEGGQVAPWQGVLSSLHGRLLPYLDTVEMLSRADGLLQQARVLIGQTAERVQIHRTLEVEEQARALEGIGQALLTSFQVEELTDVLIQDLPRLGIPSCYLSLYEDPESPTQQSRLILAYDAQGPVELEPGGRLFPSTHLVPQELGSLQRRFTFVVEPLYFRETQLGFILFEVGLREGRVYEVLRGQISSALQGAALIDQVESRARLIQATTEVSRVASSILAPGELMQEVVDLIRQLFDLYYVGLFLVDQSEGAATARDQWAYLQAGTGEAGVAMRRQRHRLKVGGNSMVGQCVATAKPRIALDAGQEALRFINPQLPETRSELALPLVSRGQTIGALSIQSSEKAAFTEDQIAIFQTMASQLANSIENAYLLEETQRAMEELTAVQRRYVREGWSRYLDRDK